MKLLTLLETAFLRILETAGFSSEEHLHAYADHRDLERKLPSVTVAFARPETGTGALGSHGIHRCIGMVHIAHPIKDPKDDGPVDSGIEEHTRISDAVHGILAGPVWREKMKANVATINAMDDLGLAVTAYTVPQPSYARLGAEHQTVFEFTCTAARRSV